MHYEKFQDGSVKCIEDEIPFEVPEGWCWSRLQSITSILTDGTHKTPQYSDAGYIFLSSKNVTSGKIDWDNIMYIPETLHRELYTRLAPKAGDILLAKNGTTGVAAIVDREEVFDIYVSLALIRIVHNIVNPLYVLRAIESSSIQDHFNSSLKGIGVPNLHLEHIRKTLIPIPPCAEQDRIILRADTLIPLVEQIATDEKELQRLISETKTKILDLAIRGKLVPQNPDDEPASVLLERIRAEKEELIKQGKIKRDKKESVIFKGEDNSYYATIEGAPVAISEYLGFELPLGWTWITLGDIALVTSGKTPKSIQLSISGEVPYFKVADMNVQGNELYMQYSDNYVNESYSGPIFEKGSFIFPKNGGAVLTNKKRILLQSSVVDLNTGVFTPSHLIDSKFAFYLFTSIDFSKIYKGAVIPTVDSSVIRNLIYAMPPLEEQKRIASAITTIFTKIEKIEAALF